MKYEEISSIFLNPLSSKMNIPFAPFSSDKDVGSDVLARIIAGFPLTIILGMPSSMSGSTRAAFIFLMYEDIAFIADSFPPDMPEASFISFSNLTYFSFRPLNSDVGAYLLSIRRRHIVFSYTAFSRTIELIVLSVILPFMNSDQWNTERSSSPVFNRS